MNRVTRIDHAACFARSGQNIWFSFRDVLRTAKGVMLKRSLHSRLFMNWQKTDSAR